MSTDKNASSNPFASFPLNEIQAMKKKVKEDLDMLEEAEIEQAKNAAAMTRKMQMEAIKLVDSNHENMQHFQSNSDYINQHVRLEILTSIMSELANKKKWKCIHDALYFISVEFGVGYYYFIPGTKVKSILARAGENLHKRDGELFSARSVYTALHGQTKCLPCVVRG